MKKDYLVVDSLETLSQRLAEIRNAQKKYATYTQEQVDKIFLAASLAANKARIELAKMAVEETGMGVVEDKVIKNHYASEYIYNKYRYEKTCGVIEEDKAYGIKKVAEPIGVISAIENKTDRVSMDDYNGLYLTNPKLSLAMMLAMFSLAGIPPFAGFFSKFFIFAAAAEQGF